jgi:hypothetical protein
MHAPQMHAVAKLEAPLIVLAPANDPFAIGTWRLEGAPSRRDD